MSAIASSIPAGATFAPMSARRLYIFGGIALIAGGMLFGDIFAVFILHQFVSSDRLSESKNSNRRVLGASGRDEVLR